MADFKIKIRNSLAAQLLYMIFGLYFIVTFVVTTVQLSAEYFKEKEDIISEIQQLPLTFGDGMSLSMWTFDYERLQASLTGINRLPIVSGIRIKDLKGREVSRSGTNSDAEGNLISFNEKGEQISTDKKGFFTDMFEFTFPLVYIDENSKPHNVGYWIVYSNQMIILNRVKYGFILILINSIIKTTALWFIFYFIIRKILGVPLEKLKNDIEQINMENLENVHMTIPSRRNNEFKMLEVAFNAMIGNLNHSRQKIVEINQNLEKTVKERTIELQAAIDWLRLENKERLTAEKKANISEYNYRALFDNSTDAIFVHDIDTGIILDCNRTMLEMYEYSKDEVINSSIDRFSAQQPPYTQSLADGWINKARKEGSQCFEWLAKRKDQTVFWGEVVLKQASIGNDQRLLAFVRDISERKQAEDQIKASLKEKETLLQEIHHRVKNNMAVISSLLALQEDRVDDSITKEILRDSQNRVWSMLMIHESLYRSDNLSAINLESYLTELGKNIIQNYSMASTVQYIVEAETIMINTKQASPVGLIVNELITNCLKYAFPDDRAGEIVLSLKSIKENGIELAVSDNGVGIPEDFDLKSTDTLGLKLVKLLAEDQLRGLIEMESNNGTKFTIKFNIEA